MTKSKNSQNWNKEFIQFLHMWFLNAKLNFISVIKNMPIKTEEELVKT